jgi:hypothetical protein
MKVAVVTYLIGSIEQLNNNTYKLLRSEGPQVDSRVK